MPTNFTDTPSTFVIIPASSASQATLLSQPSASALLVVAQTNAKGALYTEVLKASWAESGRVFANPELLSTSWKESAVTLEQATFPKGRRQANVQSRVTAQ